MTSQLVLLGFEDWLEVDGQKLPNPARLVVEEANANPQPWLDASGCDQLKTVLLPVPDSGDLARDLATFRSAFDPVLDRLEPQNTVLAMGQGHLIQPPVLIESRAVNRLVGLHGEVVLEHDGEMARSMNRRVKDRLRSELEERERTSHFALSENAGTYYCNAVYYLLEAMRNRWFVHLPAFLEGYENEAAHYWNQYQGFFQKKYPSLGAENISYGTTENQVLLLQVFLQVIRSCGFHAEPRRNNRRRGR